MKSTKWNKPHISKIYEALTAIADSRIELVDETHARCHSSSRGKFYEIEFDLNKFQIMSNDNTAYFTDSVSYPMIAVLMLKNKITYEEKLLGLLSGIIWKDIMQKYKNNYDRGIGQVLQDLASQGKDIDFIKNEIDKVYKQVESIDLYYLGNKRFPPRAY